jgi:diguanylate cyclase
MRVDIDDSAQEAAQWKRKYFDALEDAESREKQWRQADELLRHTISRLTLAADGLDPALDRQLLELRNAIRDRSSAAQLRSRIDAMSKTLVKLDSRRKQESRSEDVLLQLLDALSLPKGTGRQSKALNKLLRSAASEDSEAVVSAFADLMHKSLELAGSQDDKGVASPRRTGLFGRLFGREGKSVALAPETGPASPPGAASRSALHSADSIQEILIQLLERLSLPDELAERLETVRAHIEAMREGEPWDSVLEQIADLVQAIRAQTQREKQGIENFLLQITGRLQEVDRHLQDSGRFHEQSETAGEQFDSAVKQEIAGMETSVHGATDLDQLKTAMQTHLDTVMEHLDRHRESERRRYDRARQEAAAVSKRLGEVEGEAERLRSQLKEERSQAMTDALTGIPNRLAYDDRLQQEVARWKRFGTPLVLAVWDIDHFKNVNDRFGHRAGDKVLRTVAGLLAERVRETDFIARYGGEEFVQLMTGSSLEDCLPVCDRMRAAIEATGFHFREQAVTITASCGLAEMRDGDSTEQWFERADKALYRAKENGRNRCETDD